MAGIPIIDTHIHLFDTRRPQGVPWPEKEDTILYRPALPGRYCNIAAPQGISGAIVVEASPLLEDNQWLLDLAVRSTMIVGIVGNLEPGAPNFGRHLERFCRNPLFRGIRFGDLWGRNLGQALFRPAFISDLELLANAGLELDIIGADSTLISDTVRLTDKIPSLRVVIDHLPQLDPPAESRALGAYEANLRELRERRQVYAKVSAVLRRIDGRVPQNLDFYRPRLDELWVTFGADRLLYASDWPNSDLWGSYAQTVNLTRRYFMEKGSAIATKFLWKNSVAAYHWVIRRTNQPEPEA